MGIFVVAVVVVQKTMAAEVIKLKPKADASLYSIQFVCLFVVALVK